MINLAEWINPEYLDPVRQKKHKDLFVDSKPFSHLELPRFFNEKKVRAVLSAVEEEPMFLKDSDLFTFLQSNDFVSSSNKTVLEFREIMMSGEFTAVLCAFTGSRCESGRIDMSASVYANTHYLLCHDDRLEKRKLAYLVYLSDLNEGDGGELALYSSKNGKPTRIEKCIRPTFNSLVIFSVSTTSFHMVKEVTRDIERIAIGGWFY